MKIRTYVEWPPVTNREYDWTAIDENAYDGDGSPIGRGTTADSAIADLLEQLRQQEALTHD